MIGLRRSRCDGRRDRGCVSERILICEGKRQHLRQRLRDSRRPWILRLQMDSVSSYRG